MKKLLNLPVMISALTMLTVPLLHAEDWPAPIKAVEARGAEIIQRFDAPSGLQGYAARYNGQGVALYLTADGEHVLVGSLLNAQGEDLSRQPLDKFVYEAGDVQIRHVMVGMLRQDSVEKAAALLNAKDQQAALHEHESAGKASQLQGLKKIPAAIQQQLDSNLGLMAEMGVAATPAIFYPDESGQLRQQRGAPSPDVLKQIMGPRS